MAAKRKCVSYKSIIDYWKPILNESEKYNSVFIDFGEPTCWACGEYWNGEYDCNNESIDDICYSNWEKAPLEKCHIIAKSLGGSDDPSNFFLMCKMCHVNSPDTTSNRLFFNWVKSQASRKNYIQTILNTFKDLNFDINDLNNIKKINIFFDKHHEPFKKFMIANSTTHFSKYSIVTLVATILLYIENHIKI